ncbi:Brg1 DNA-binding transcription factor [Carex littledalei]|uniref:Brg1 DNA-binding transcription factor n=1 Tax=Carex littledalei TaxID=544730 RepID=A0A833RTG0_9POAL|nr:Brg1 DNA-binding transcription factor [Carex littledalei]
MAFNLFSASSSSTKKRICEEQQLGDYDENGFNLKLTLEPPCSLDLKLSLLPAPPQTKKCHVCQGTETPIWRTGPKGMRVGVGPYGSLSLFIILITLCNACGLKYRKLDHRRKACLAEGIPMWYSKAIDREFADFVGENWK